MDDTGCPRLTDFGFSCITSESGSTASNTDGHAVRWAAPEVLDMKLPVSKASDVFSFAMVIIEACGINLSITGLFCLTSFHKTFTGKPPFNNSVPTAVAVGILAGSRPERPTHPNLTDNVWNLTQRCWDKDTKQRPDISEIVLRLQTIHGDNVTLDSSLSGKLSPSLFPLRQVVLNGVPRVRKDSTARVFRCFRFTDGERWLALKIQRPSQSQPVRQLRWSV